MEELITQVKEFKDLIHVIRGQQVMLDSDLAQLYGYEIKAFNQQVKRNIKRFPDDFKFQLTKEETLIISRSQNVTSIQTKGGKGGRSYQPYVFIEQGIYMLSAVLKGELAEKQSIYIIREFKKMRHYLTENKSLLSYTELLHINNRLDKHEVDINKIMNNFIDETKIKEITFLNGQKFEANEAYISIYRQAKHTIYVIDDFVDIDTLSLLKHKQEIVNVTIFTANKGVPKLQRLEVNNFNSEYPNLYVKRIKSFHDRYIILDYGTKDEVMYHCGHSSKDTRNKVSTIHKMLDIEVIHPIIDKLLENEDIFFE